MEEIRESTNPDKRGALYFYSRWIVRPFEGWTSHVGTVQFWISVTAAMIGASAYTLTEEAASQLNALGGFKWPFITVIFLIAIRFTLAPYWLWRELKMEKNDALLKTHKFTLEAGRPRYEIVKAEIRGKHKDTKIELVIEIHNSGRGRPMDVEMEYFGVNADLDDAKPNQITESHLEGTPPGRTDAGIFFFKIESTPPQHIMLRYEYSDEATGMRYIDEFFLGWGGITFEGEKGGLVQTLVTKLSKKDALAIRDFRSKWISSKRPYSPQAPNTEAQLQAPAS